MEKQLSIKFLIFFRNHLLILAALVGIIAGCFAVIFSKCIVFIEHFSFSILENQESIYYFPVITTVGGLIAGLIIQKIPQARGSGIPEISLIVSRLKEGIKSRFIIGKFLGALTTIGTGFSLGKEGPTVTLGAGSGTLVSSIFRLTGKKEKQLIAAGAGSGLAAAFNTPIAGVMFVLEELLHNLSYRFLAPCIVATVLASAVTRHFGGDRSYFSFLTFSQPTLLENIHLYLLLACIVGFIASLYSRSIMMSIDLFSKFKKIPIFLKITFVGFIVGLIGLVLPDITGSGHIGAQKFLNGNFVLWILPILIIGKILLTSFCYGSGAPGGLFAPLLFCGAGLGLFVGKLINWGFPLLDVSATSFALVGMGAFFAAVVRTPITATLMIFELTGNSHFILPVMLCSIVSNVVASKIFPRAIYPALLFRSTGIDLEQEEIKSPLEQFTVADVMTKDFEYVSKRTTLSKVLLMMEKSHHHSFPVISHRGRLLGIVTHYDLDEAVIHKLPGDISIDQIMTKNVVTVVQNAKINKALELMFQNKIGRLIVIDPLKKAKPVGIITKTDILKAEVKTI